MEKRKLKLLPHGLVAAIEPRASNASAGGDRVRDCVFYAGAVVPWIDWEAMEIVDISFDPKGFDLSRLNAGAPVLDRHMDYSIENQLGVVQNARVEGKLAKAELRFSKRPEVDGIWADVEDNIIRNVSMGVNWQASAMKDITPKDAPRTARRKYLVTESQPHEVSLVPSNADQNAQFLSLSPGSEERAKFSALASEIEVEVAESALPTFEIRDVMDANTTTLALQNRATAQEEQPMENPTGSNAQTQPTQPAAPPSAAAIALANNELDAARADAARTERLRVMEIQKIGRLMGVDPTSVQKLIDSGTSLDLARKEIIDQVASRAEDPNNPRSGGAIVLRDENDGHRDAAVLALLNRYDPVAWAVKRDDLARQYMGMSLFDIAKHSLEKKGVWVKGLNRDEVAGLALRQGPNNGGSFVAHMGAMSTSDFPGILADVANKTLRQAYEKAPRTFTTFCRRTTAPDFKNINRLQLGEAPSLVKVNQSGEFKYGSVSEMKETYALATYGKIVSFTRQTIINDDLQAITRIPAAFGQSAANLESDTVWSIITTNGNMGDATALFHANHKNLVSSGSGAPSVTNVKALRTLAGKQVGIDGVTILNIQLKYIIVPVALITDAEQLVTAITPAQSSNVTPEFYRALTPVAEPRLDANSAAVWYMAADPAQIDTIEYCYLEGQDGVFLETRQGFNVDGIEIKARLDFAAKAIDWRGLYKTVGTA